jgi:hypothetical protein
MSSGNVTLHPFNSGAAAIMRACPERAQRVERETSLIISVRAVCDKMSDNRNSHRFPDFARNDKGGLPDNVFHIIFTAQNA